MIKSLTVRVTGDVNFFLAFLDLFYLQLYEWLPKSVTYKLGHVNIRRYIANKKFLYMIGGAKLVNKNVIHALLW